MDMVFKWLQLVVTVIGGFLGWFLGGFDGFLYALIAFVVADYITGVMCAVIDRSLSSRIGARGIFKKVLVFVMVGIANVIDSKLIGSGDALRTAVIFFYLSNEGISIIENVGHIGLPVPQRLKNVLTQLNNQEEEQGKEYKE